MLHLAPDLVGDLSQVEAVSPRMPFEPASQGWITKDRSAAGHIGDPRQATAAKGADPFPRVLPRRRHLSGAGDPMGWPFLRMDEMDAERIDDAEPGAASIAPNLGHLRLDAAGDHAQLHGSPGPFAASDRDQPRARAEQRRLCRHRGRIRNRFCRRRRCLRSRRRPDQPAVALSRRCFLCWSLVGYATGWVTTYRELLVCRVLLGFFEAGQWPCALVTAQRLLSRRDRPLGNSIIQSGASLGAIATPVVVLYLATRFDGRLAAAVPRHRCGRRRLGRRLVGRRPVARRAARAVRHAGSGIGR